MDIKAEDELVEDDEEGVKVKRSRSIKTDHMPQRAAKSLGIRTQDPYVHSAPSILVLITRKQFGHIPGVEVGRTWASRIECSTDAIHA
jgi:E3 ubiquitin-protein ligase UHRF1